MSVIIRPVGQLKSFFNNQSTITVEAGQTVREILVAAKILPELVADNSFPPEVRTNPGV